jgi:GTP-binding protein HflX
VSSESNEHQTRSRNGTVEAGVRNPRARQRAVAIGVLTGAPGEDGELREMRELLRTAGVATESWMVQQRSEPVPDRYFGRGKLAELEREIKRSGANLIACDDELAPRQERNLESALGVPVIDRTAVILDIFADHAHSAEGKLQVELAQLEYNLARMRGLWTHLERLGAGRMDGGIGTRGPGESQIETDRRLARDRISALRRELRVVERSRGTMRAERDRSSIPTVALAGYTNAGKSTLLNAITGAGVGVGDRLFHTLDPTTRSYEHAGRKYLLTDTVGFIRKLPHQLVDAFKATLEETTLADLIVHVVDGSEAPAARAAAMRAVDSVLEEIGAGDTPRVLVFNKLDLLGPDERRDLLVGSGDAIGISAASGDGVGALLDAIEAAFAATLEPVELLIPYDDGAALSDLHAIAGQVERDDREDGVLVRARVPRSHSHRFATYSVGGVDDISAA